MSISLLAMSWACENCPFTCGDLDPHLIHGSLGPPESISWTASRSVQLFLPWHGQHDWPRYSVCSNRPHLGSAPMWPNNNSQVQAGTADHAPPTNLAWPLPYLRHSFGNVYWNGGTVRLLLSQTYHLWEDLPFRGWTWTSVYNTGMHESFNG